MVTPPTKTPAATASATPGLTPHQILAGARLLVFQRAPYFRTGILQLIPREMSGLGTFATTKDWVLLWDPETAQKWGIEETAGVLVHELWHLLRDHFERFSMPGVNRDIANVATDLSINPGVGAMGFRLPAHGLQPSQFNMADNLTAERYYEELIKRAPKLFYVGEGDGDEGEGGEGSEADGKSIPVHGCGSCSGRAHKKEPKPGQPSKPGSGTPDEGDDEDGKDGQQGRTQGEINRAKAAVAADIQEAQAQGRGRVPADLVKWANGILTPPKVRWQEKLARSCRAAVAYRPGSGHTTYAKISRRQAGIGFGGGCPVLPSYRATKPQVTLLIDTSGSMGQDATACVMSEAQGILAACGSSLDVVVCDAEVHGAKKVRSIQEACAMLRGGGGSDFRPAFDQIDATRPRPHLIVAATDGDITVPAHAPAGIEVIWLIVKGEYYGGRRPCAWGTFIEIERDLVLAGP